MAPADRRDAGETAAGVTLTTEQLRWPGIDKDRAVGACWHLHRALQRHLLAQRLADRPWGMSRAAAVQSAREHARIARGYLGAVGFEGGGRL